MLSFRDLLATNPNVQAVANLLALLGGLAVAVRLGHRAWRFWRYAIATSIRKARHRARISLMLEAELCSREPSFYISRLVRLFMGFGAMALFVVFAISTETASMMRTYPTLRDAYLTPSWWAAIIYAVLLCGVMVSFVRQLVALGRGVTHFVRARGSRASRTGKGRSRDGDVPPVLRRRVDDGRRSRRGLPTR